MCAPSPFQVNQLHLPPSKLGVSLFHLELHLLCGDSWLKPVTLQCRHLPLGSANSFPVGKQTAIREKISAFLVWTGTGYRKMCAPYHNFPKPPYHSTKPSQFSCPIMLTHTQMLHFTHRTSPIRLNGTTYVHKVKHMCKCLKDQNLSLSVLVCSFLVRFDGPNICQSLLC